jgi:flagellar protein FliJ
MARDFPLRPVLELAQRRLDAAAARLQKLGTQRQEAQAKLAQLQGFQAEYRANLQQGLQQGMEPHRLRDFEAFLAKLDRAIGLQSAEVERISQAWEAGHREWLQLRSSEQALRVLEQRHHAARAAEEARREQKQQDEFSAGKARQAGDA